VVLLKMLSVFI